MLDDFDIRIQSAHESPEFIEFMADVTRNELAHEEPEPPAAYDVVGHVDPRHVTAFTAYVASCGVIEGFLGVMSDGVVFVSDGRPLPQQDIKELAAIVAGFKTPANETRVSRIGRHYRAEARLAGGPWKRAGTYTDENEAQRAADAKLAGLRAGMVKGAA